MSGKRESTRMRRAAALPTYTSYCGAAYHHSRVPAIMPATNLSVVAISRRDCAARPEIEEANRRSADDGLPDGEVKDLEELRLVSLEKEQSDDAREVQDLNDED